MQKHQVGILTDLFRSYVGFPYQPFRTDSGVARSIQQQAGTSNTGREFASRGHLSMLKLMFQHRSCSSWSGYP